MTAFKFRNGLTSAAALAGLACAALLTAAEPAAAKSANTCMAKVTACDNRCAARYPGDDGGRRRCNQRTCNPQHANCLKNSVGGPSRPGADGGGKDGRTGPIVRDKRPKRPPVPRGGSAEMSTPASSPQSPMTTGAAPKPSSAATAIPRNRGGVSVTSTNGGNRRR